MPLDSISALRLLRLTPVITTTAQFVFAHDQDFNLKIFNADELSTHRPSISAILSHFFTRFVYTGVPIITALAAVTVGSSVANLRQLSAADSSLETTRQLYKVGIALAVGHFAYLPFIAPYINKISASDGKDKTEVLRDWLWWHKLRMMTVDLGAFVCFLVGFLSLPTETL